jgi:hypothetical protein
MSADPWLSGLLACPLGVDADAVRAALHARGLKTRSVPAGRAKGAWTCVTDRGTLAVIISGKGAEAARQAASFWMPRARWVVLAQAGPGTGLAAEAPAGAEAGAGTRTGAGSTAADRTGDGPTGARADAMATSTPAAPDTITVVLDGDPDLQALAARGAPRGSATQQARVAAVPEPVLGPAARDTLASSGFAAWDPNVDAWRQAATAIGGVVLICHAVTTTAPDREPDLLQQIPDGATRRPWWRTTMAKLLPAQRRANAQTDERHRQAVSAAAACAVAALLGPHHTAP